MPDVGCIGDSDEIKVMGEVLEGWEAHQTIAQLRPPAWESRQPFYSHFWWSSVCQKPFLWPLLELEVHQIWCHETMSFFCHIGDIHDATCHWGTASVLGASYHIVSGPCTCVCFISEINQEAKTLCGMAVCPWLHGNSWVAPDHFLTVSQPASLHLESLACECLAQIWGLFLWVFKQ